MTVHVVCVPQLDASPPQPANVDPESGVAVNCTAVPTTNSAESLVQVVPQSIPTGLEVTLPVPVPVASLLAVRVYCASTLFAFT